MAFGMKNGRRSMEQPDETKEKEITSEKIAESDKKAEKKAENYDDCGKKEIKEKAGKPGAAEELKEAEDEYAACEKKLDKMEKKNPELAKETGKEAGDKEDEYADCGKEEKETKGHYVAEVTYVKDSDDTNADNRVAGAYAECKNPEDMNELKEKVNEKGVKAVDAKIIEKPEEVEKTPEKEAEKPVKKVEDAVDETKHENALKETEKAKEKLEQKQAEAVEHQEEVEQNLKNEEIKEQQTEQKPSYEERMEAVRNTENVKDISKEDLKELKTENNEKTQEVLKEKEETVGELQEKFDNVMSKPRGSEEYKEALKDYNETRQRIQEQDERIQKFQEEKEELERKSAELRQVQIAEGEAAAANSGMTVALSKELQQRYDENFYDKKPNLKELDKIQQESTETITELTEEREAVKTAMDAKMEEISEYVTSNGLERYDTAHDPYYQKMISEYNSLKETESRLDYNIVKLDENNISISELTGKEYESVQKRNVETVADTSVEEKVETVAESEITDGEIKEKVKEAAEEIKLEGSFDALPEERQEKVYEAFENAPDEIKEKVKDYAEDLDVEDTQNNECCHYDPVEKKIRMEAHLDNEEYAEIFTHEFGHLVDDNMGNVSQSVEFREAVNADLAYYDRSTELGRKNFEAMMDDLMESDAAYDRAVSDNLSAYFKNDPEVINRYYDEGVTAYGHENAYWAVDGKAEAEIFANNFSMAAQGNQDSCEFMKKYFPNTWEAYEKTLDNKDEEEE